MNDKTSAFHVSGEGDHIVGIGNLRVLIVKEGDFWYAQGLEIDYVAQGETSEDVREAFQEGLVATIHENLKIHGTIEPVLKVAPQEIWKKILTPPHRFTQVSSHQIDPMPGFPFEGIGYLEPVESV